MFAKIFLLRSAPAAKQQVCNAIIQQISGTTRTYSSRIPTRMNEVTNSAEVPKFSFKMTSVSNEERQQFDSIFPVIVRDVTGIVKDLDIPNVTAWCTRLLEHNVSLGKKRRAFSTILSYKLLADPQELTPEKMRLAGIMGWCTEMLTAPFLMIDDILDQSEMRRGVPCWYKVKDVGMSAVNDAVVLENITYALLRKYFRDHPCYPHMLELFRGAFLKISIGQGLDWLMSNSGKSDLQLFSMERYRTIAMHKFACFAFEFPVAAAMYLAGIHDTKLHAEAGAILQEMGYWAQVKNDFLDCFGDVTSNGATLYGDIREGKCAWPIVVALERASPKQREILDQCYGQPDEQSVQAVMDVFRALTIPGIYASYEEETLNNIRKQVELLEARVSKQIFYNILQML